MQQKPPPKAPWPIIEDDQQFHLRIRQGSTGRAVITSIAISTVFCVGFALVIPKITDGVSLDYPTILLFLAFALFFWYDGKQAVRWHFDGLYKTLTITEFLFGIRVRSTVYPLREVSVATCHEYKGADSSAYSVRLSFIVNDGPRHHLVTTKDAPSTQQLAYRINTWLDSHRPRA